MPMWLFSKRRHVQPSTAVFAACVLLLNLPNFLWLESRSILPLDGAEFIERLIQCLSLSAGFLILFTRPWRAWLLLWLLFLWWQPLALGVRAINGMPINANLVGMVMATSPAELRNLATIIPWGWFSFFAFWNLACWSVLCVLHHRSQWRWEWRFRRKVLFFSVALLALPYVVQPNPAAVAQSRAMLTTTLLAHPGSTNPWHSFSQADQPVGNALYLYLAEAFPYELPWAVVQYWQARRVVDAVRAHLRSPAPGEMLVGVANQAEVVVLVIGESATRNAWSWFHPATPPTTPLLEARAARGEHLFGFSRTLAQTASTRQAVPSMLTAQPLVWPDGSPNPQATHSIVAVAAQAGYATAWFSNQAAVGKYDGIVASYAQEAAATAFMNPSGFADQGSLDEVLLPALRRHLAENARAFVVLHTLGSHFNYQHRYPRGFGPYPHSSSAREAYFNSVAYTDKVLDQVIDALKRDGRRAVLVYAADHGETVPGGICNAGSSNRNTREAYEVPALVWLSDPYAHTYPSMVEQLRAHRNHPYTVAAVHQTVLDLMRGHTQMPLSDPGTLSFARSSRQLDASGRELIPKWQERFEKAVAKNPCSMNLDKPS